MALEWSQKSAANAYLDTLKLCGKQKEECSSAETPEPESNEFLSALAAGMSAKLIVEVTSEVSPSTVALAAAARQTGGKVVCILPEPELDTSQKAIDDSGLNDMVEFRTEDPVDVLPNYENIDFSLVDCKTEGYPRLLNMLDVNPRRSVVVANNLVEGRKGLGGNVKGGGRKLKVRSMKHPIGKGMEVTMIGKGGNGECGKKDRVGRGLSRSERKGSLVKRTDKSKWVFGVDEKSGEEHIFRVPRSL
ncbi:hypothetical protein RJ639_022474 [Escallonia herrerae]|uniref:S-adenosyl-L-methionine-dependent methyltransferase n=1 Tax=Escallonia herrerae TaxID=1293975 RepID=A0AA88V3I9_9ASTE|nr:hypothetical protein RJ639_022474 [Escallonia herrerae]